MFVSEPNVPSSKLTVSTSQPPLWQGVQGVSPQGVLLSTAHPVGKQETYFLPSLSRVTTTKSDVLKVPVE